MHGTSAHACHLANVQKSLHAWYFQRSVLLVHQTKTSANELVLPYANQWVNLSGFALQHGPPTTLHPQSSNGANVCAPKIA